MNKENILKLLEDIAAGKKSPADVLKDLCHLPFEEMDFAKVDSHRHLRNGFSEVIYCRGKTTEHIISITRKMLENGMNVLGTRTDPEVGEHIIKEIKNAEFDPLSGTFMVLAHKIESIKGRLAILAAGTADLKVAEEAKRTANFFGAEVRTYYDVGVAGLHRLLAHVKELDDNDVLIAVAGMEGALPSVLGGLVSKPIIAVPTSVGYGSNFGGVTPLFAMLNSCSEGITVVNIDNGFGAACAALRIVNGLTG
ncbi:MAG: 1-(5-phosphoribosyl)-5-amino-4-imidazole-carboxylate carboxylase [Deltaproteobacteria bacterium CG11_big_fil_rev_8_21_14_0_20_49_13]|nr:MAG: 1-(5-phosphoribosyl)-5-amino-4-imidazole-carboxylate carboxylase [Deltaproteobacteria bacterium CG11_big_fil_rev_8_21_14_0_20_49_13]